MSKKYHITVGGDRLKTIQVGKIEPNTNFTVLSEDRGETLAKRGDVGFPNKCKVWAARVIDGKMPKADEPAISITDPKYRGELIGLKWGAKGGSVIDVRYLSGYPSNDVLYQEKVLNYRINDEDESSADAFFLFLPNGDVDFDEATDPFYIQHLEWHAYNFNSESKNPNFYTHYFREKSFEQEERLDTVSWDDETLARNIVSEIGSGANDMAKCKILFSIVRVVNDEEPEDTKVYAYLKMISAKRASLFLSAINAYKLKVSNMFEKLKSYEMVDTTTDGKLVVEVSSKGVKKKEILLTDLPSKGEGIFDYMLENFADPSVFEATYKLIQITDKIK
jgi:hypothetical protein